jgi:uncharacterized protein YkwD
MTAALVRPRRASIFALLTIALCVAGLAVVTAPTARAASGETSMAARWDKSTYERNVIRQINRKRAKHGLRKLRAARCPDRTADRWSKHLSETDRFYHQDMGNVLARCDAYYAGETLVKGAISPRRAVRLWMRSPGHRAILLSKKPKRLGIGSHVNSHGQWVTAANFVRF